MNHECIVCCPGTAKITRLCDKCASPQNIQEREYLFNSILKIFQKTAEANNLQVLKTLCESLAISVSKIPLEFIPTSTFDKEKHSSYIDEIAKSYMQGQTRFNSFIPLTTEEDGNCLYHSINRLMPGMTASATELRLRAMIEVVNNYHTYNAIYPNLIEICDELLIYCQEVKDKQHSQVWDILGLCNVLKCRIQLICAKHPPSHKLQNTMFSPTHNGQDTTNIITLMWTNALSENDLVCLGRAFSVDHFVPLLNIHSMNNLSGKMPNIFILNLTVYKVK